MDQNSKRWIGAHRCGQELTDVDRSSQRWTGALRGGPELVEVDQSHNGPEVTHSIERQIEF